MAFVLLFLYGFLISYVQIPQIVSVVKKFKLFKKPKGRDLHSENIPKLTGIAFFTTIVSISFFFVQFEDLNRILIFIASTSIITYIGIRDDIYELDAKTKLFLQFVAITLVIFGDNMFINNLNGFINIYALPNFIAYPFTYFVGFFMINAFNLCDGIDGLGAGMAFIIMVSYAFLFWVIDEHVLMYLSTVIAGCMIAFLRFNLSKNKRVFMGDSGSLFLGFVIFMFTLYWIGTDSIIIQNLLPSKKLTVLASLVLFIIPIIDSGSIFFYRLNNKKSPFEADNNHLHHLVLRFSKNHHLASLILCSFLFFSISLFSWLSFNLDSTVVVGLFFAYLIFCYVVLAKVRRSNKKNLNKKIVVTNLS